MLSAGRVYRSCWVAATLLTGLVAGFMLGHALLLGRFLDWLLTNGPRAQGFLYPTFSATAGRSGLTIFYAICGLQVISVLAFFGLALAARRAPTVAAVAAATGTVWLLVHYASGFGALEATVLRATAPVPPDVVAGFLRLNVPIHVFHALMLTTSLGALLSLPVTSREHDRPTPRMFP